ncbi:sigma-70 family RNA polymerase sigma factor [Aeromicrobium fastidiosum]|uniref:Sigma-70 family RNA polymerase sigma factor n=1 Tax=Aeromicrobium fastidiosum TaxID=52699 RepID=A0A641AR63_9ACTN|nr:sigma-70 family RNA polymerase sigma factor [Aeromicrobium fastidiosum]KAA1378572.1 sigma-70 family RNA polymerase sigma factor [Aeromicrobium fastidiosum]MBP2392453.1 RNA polymerase sigma-70 factor (ECF subfamily) [Aeromicrobium fastidiosum]
MASSTSSGDDPDDGPDDDARWAKAPGLRAAYLENRDMLHRIAATTLRSAGLESQAQDVVQSSVFALWRTPPNGVKSWAALLVTTVKRRAIDVIKSAEVKHTGFDLDDVVGRFEAASQVDVESEFVAATERSEIITEVRDAVGDLPADHREVLNRMFYLEQTQAQIADALGLTPGRISQIKKAAFAQLAAKLEHRRG